MTVSAELALGAARLELILCIEGMGWPTDEQDLSSGFDGDVFATADQDGDLASKLGCTVHTGLKMQGSIGDSINTLKGSYSVSAIQWEIIDHDDYLLGAFVPNKTPGSTTLSADLTYDSTEPFLTDGTSFADGDVAWVSNREAILLAGKTLVGGTEYKYTGSTRAYLGTDRGRPNGIPAAQATGHAFRWLNNTTVYDDGFRWRGRYVNLYAHIPGEASSNCVLWFSGRLSSLDSDWTGITYTGAASGDPLRDLSRIRVAPDVYAADEFAAYPPNEAEAVDDSDLLVGAAVYGSGPSYKTTDEFGTRRVLSFRPPPGLMISGYPRFAIAGLYRYRTEVGGTAGMIQGWSTGSLQALDTSTDTDVCMEFIRVGGSALLALKRFVDEDGTLREASLIELENVSRAGGNGDIQITGNSDKPQLEMIVGEQPCRPLLSNWLEQAEFNRYAVDNKVTRNPIDILLCHMLSRDDEYYIADATGGTTTVPTFAAGVGADDLWIGAGLFCVEGNNKGEARVISDNNNTSITVEDAFTNAPTAATEYQVRNSVYDVLPIGWGIGVPWWRVDVDAFEEVRDKYFSDAEVDRYIIGNEDYIDIWEWCNRVILEPYGIAIRVNTSTAKIEPVYVGPVATDGLVSTATAIGDDDILNIGRLISGGSRNPLDAVKIKVRATSEQIVNVQTQRVQVGVADDEIFPGMNIKTPVMAWRNDIQREEVPSQLGGQMQDIVVALRDDPADYYPTPNRDKQTFKIESPLDTAATADYLVSRARYILANSQQPSPIVSMRLKQDHIGSVQSGDIISLTLGNAPRNPFTGSRGWTNVISRVISTAIVFQPELALDITAEMLSENSSGLISPAANVSSKGTDGTSDYIIVSASAFVSDANANKDYYDFVTTDRIAIRDSTGVIKIVVAVRSFGVNDVSDPTAASTDWIRITGSLAAYTHASGDYVTFDTDGALTPNRIVANYVALADSSDDTFNSSPKRYH